MKKFVLVLLAVAMVAGLSGCSKDDDIDVTGTWSFVVHWVSPTINATVPVYLYNDGVVIIGGKAGSWVLDGKSFTMLYFGATYKGTSNGDGDAITGTMTNTSGNSGSFAATLATRSLPARSAARAAADVEAFASGGL